MISLTEHMVLTHAKQSDLFSVASLNCWGNDLVDITILRRMKNIRVCSLSVNRIRSLAPFKECTRLEELYLRNNNIQSLKELVHLQSLPRLKYLWIEDNPCCVRAGPNYRAKVLRSLPGLKKLDTQVVTEFELEEALGQSAENDFDDDVTPPNGSGNRELDLQQYQQTYCDRTRTGQIDSQQDNAARHYHQRYQHSNPMLPDSQTELKLKQQKLRRNLQETNECTCLKHRSSGRNRQPVLRTSNLLSAALCIVKQLNYDSLAVLEHSVRCRIDELNQEG